jgi:hypothetical protein
MRNIQAHLILRPAREIHGPYRCKRRRRTRPKPPGTQTPKTECHRRDRPTSLTYRWIVKRHNGARSPWPSHKIPHRRCLYLRVRQHRRTPTFNSHQRTQNLGRHLTDRRRMRYGTRQRHPRGTCHQLMGMRRPRRPTCWLVLAPHPRPIIQRPIRRPRTLVPTALRSDADKPSVIFGRCRLFVMVIRLRSPVMEASGCRGRLHLLLACWVIRAR